MKTYKLFKVKRGKLFPLYVEANSEMPIGKWLTASVGEKADETHVKSKLGKLSLRPGFHSTEVPFTDWIGQKMPDGTLAQKPDTVWCECEVKGKQFEITNRHGSRELLNGWYYFKTNSRQERPWIISKQLKIIRVLSNKEVAEICRSFGIEPQRVA